MGCQTLANKHLSNAIYASITRVGIGGQQSLGLILARSFLSQITFLYYYSFGVSG